MPILHVKATDSGRVVSWPKLKQGQLADTQRLRSLAPTTVLTDVVTDIHDLCRTLDSNCRFVTIIPNGFTSLTFNLAFIGRGFEVTCTRRIVRGWFPLNLVAQEFGGNYDVVVTVNGTNGDAIGKVLEMLKSNYQCSAVT